jgi:class 3 adenylate cyclase
MISSIDLIKKTGISRATLNNYIKWGLLPRPVVRKPAHPGLKSRRIGYFPDTSLEKIKKIQELKKKGELMPDIIKTLANLPGQGDNLTDALSSEPKPELSIIQENLFESGEFEEQDFKVSLSGFSYPAYLMNDVYEIIWGNTGSEDWVFHQRLDYLKFRDQRNIFRLFLNMDWFPEHEKIHPLALSHISLLKSQKPREYLETLFEGISKRDVQNLTTAFDLSGAPGERNHSMESYVRLYHEDGTCGLFRLDAFNVREGMLCILQPVSRIMEPIAEYLAGREEILSDLLARNDPMPTPVAILASNLEDSEKIRAELAPEEFLELTVQIGNAVKEILVRSQGVFGRHYGDGFTYIFLGDRDPQYISNAIHCALDIRESINEISHNLNKVQTLPRPIHLNIGMDAGLAYLGNAYSVSGLEWSSTDEVSVRSKCVSRFACKGSILVTKNLMVHLNRKQRRIFKHGIRSVLGDREIVLDGKFARIADLISTKEDDHRRFADIFTVPVTEILDRTVDMIADEKSLNKSPKKT